MAVACCAIAGNRQAIPKQSAAADFKDTRIDWQVTPVDGGVFDVDSSGSVTIPIDAKLKVDSPYLFAITVEKPGGVVVSSRERLALVAPVKA